MSQQSRILAGVFCSGMAAALIAMAALQLPNWLQQRKMVQCGKIPPLPRNRGILPHCWSVTPK